MVLRREPKRCTGWHWHVAENGEATGPFTPAQLIEAIGAGRVTQGSLVWCAGMATWQPAGQLDALSPHLATVPPPLPEA